MGTQSRSKFATLQQKRSKEIALIYKSGFGPEKGALHLSLAAEKLAEAAVHLRVAGENNAGNTDTAREIITIVGTDLFNILNG